jgi:hypothetical protein
VRDLIEELRDFVPPSDVKVEGWKRIAAVTVAMTVTSRVATAAAKPPVLRSGAFLHKIALSILLGGASTAMLGIVVANRMSSHVVRGSSHMMIAPSVTSQAHAVPADSTLPPLHTENVFPGDVVIAPAVASAKMRHRMPLPEPSVHPIAQASDALDSESGLLIQARACLQRGDAGAAQALLDRVNATCSDGALMQEREIVAIDILSALGNRQEATRRARVFIHEYPQSPHNGSLRRLLEQTPEGGATSGQ